MTKLFASAFVGVALLGLTWSTSFGQGLPSTSQRWGYQVFETTLLVDALPLAAEVLLDGRLLGSAGALVAQAISVQPGPHVIEVRAPGYLPYAGTFTADAHSSASRFRVILSPARQ
jgi:PEGA domain-containing protein